MIIITSEQAIHTGNAIGVEWRYVNLEEFRKGLIVELEHGSRDPQTNVINDNLYLSGKIALAHLKELPDYYTRLDAMENSAVYQPQATEPSYLTALVGGIALGAILTGVYLSASATKNVKKSNVEQK